MANLLMAKKKEKENIFMIVVYIILDNGIMVISMVKE